MFVQTDVKKVERGREMKKEIKISKTYCDMCGKEISTVQSAHLDIKIGTVLYKDLCRGCLRDKVVPFIQKIPQAKYFKFELVGTFEQGGPKCPICGYVNNGYRYGGKCAFCGFKEESEV